MSLSITIHSVVITADPTVEVLRCSEAVSDLHCLQMTMMTTSVSAPASCHSNALHWDVTASPAVQPHDMSTASTTYDMCHDVMQQCQHVTYDTCHNVTPQCQHVTQIAVDNTDDLGHGSTKIRPPKISFDK